MQRIYTHGRVEKGTKCTNLSSERYELIQGTVLSTVTTVRIGFAHVGIQKLRIAHVLIDRRLVRPVIRLICELLYFPPIVGESARRRAQTDMRNNSDVRHRSKSMRFTHASARALADSCRSVHDNERPVVIRGVRLFDAIWPATIKTFQRTRPHHVHINHANARCMVCVCVFVF